MTILYKCPMCEMNLDKEYFEKHLNGHSIKDFIMLSYQHTLIVEFDGKGLKSLGKYYEYE